MQDGSFFLLTNISAMVNPLFFPPVTILWGGKVAWKRKRDRLALFAHQWSLTCLELFLIFLRRNWNFRSKLSLPHPQGAAATDGYKPYQWVVFYNSNSFVIHLTRVQCVLYRSCPSYQLFCLKLKHKPYNTSRLSTNQFGFIPVFLIWGEKFDLPFIWSPGILLMWAKASSVAVISFALLFFNLLSYSYSS